MLSDDDAAAGWKVGWRARRTTETSNKVLTCRAVYRHFHRGPAHRCVWSRIAPLFLSYMGCWQTLGTMYLEEEDENGSRRQTQGNELKCFVCIRKLTTIRSRTGKVEDEGESGGNEWGTGRAFKAKQLLQNAFVERERILMMKIYSRLHPRSWTVMKTARFSCWDKSPCKIRSLFGLVMEFIHERQWHGSNLCSSWWIQWTLKNGGWRLDVGINCNWDYH